MQDLKLMDLHLGVLFQQNMSQQLMVINEPPFNDAPLLFIGSTKEGIIQRYSYKVDDLVKQRFKNIVLYQKDDLIAGLVNQLSTRYGLHEFVMGPTYVFPKITDFTDEVILVTEENKEILKEDEHFAYVDFKIKQPCVVMMKNDKIIALCCSARQSNEAAEASVYTLEQYRSKGYGATVTKAWAYYVQQLKKTALYSTTWDNFASQGIARTLGLKQYGVTLAME